MENIIESLRQFWEFTGFANVTPQHLIMICIGLVFITLGIVKKWEPLLLVPIGFGIIIGNIPLFMDPETGLGMSASMRKAPCSTSSIRVYVRAGTRR